MRVLVNIKKAGSRRCAFVKVPYEMPFGSPTLKDILTFFVEKEVEKYNNRGQNDALLYLTEKDIDAAASAGKVCFDDPMNDKKADLQAAIENAILCFQDGLVRVFHNDTELTELDAQTPIHENDEFTLIRLSFLAGRPW